MDDPRHLTIYDGRELLGAVIGAGRDWNAVDERGNPVPGAPFNSQKEATAALNVARPSPCVADSRLDNS
jgi:hypothetical protein